MLNKAKISLLFLLLTVNIAHANNIGLESFETADIAASFSTGVVTNENAKVGDYSLSWDTAESKQLQMRWAEPVNYSGKQALIFWVYAPRAIQQPLTLRVISDTGTVEHPIHLYRRGWHSVTAVYKRDLGLTSGSFQGLDLESSEADVKLYVDMVIPAAKANAGYIPKSFTTPWINNENPNHWVSYDRTWNTPFTESAEAFSPSPRQSRSIGLATPRPSRSSKNIRSLEVLNSVLKSYNIYRNEFGFVRGPALTMGHGVLSAFSQTGEVTGDFRSLSSLINLIGSYGSAASSAYYSFDIKRMQRLATDILLLQEFITEQGWVVGEIGDPNSHHSGYTLRQWHGIQWNLIAVFGALGRTDEIKPLQDAYSWFFQTRRIRDTTGAINFDTVRTQLDGLYVAALTEPNNLDIAKNIFSLSSFLNGKGHQAIREDGTPWHHGHYADGYVDSVLGKLLGTFISLHNIGFPIEQNMYNYLRRMFMRMVDTHIAEGSLISGNFTSRGMLNPSRRGTNYLKPIEQLIAINPSDEFDKELASYYLHLTQASDAKHRTYLAKGAKPLTYPRVRAFPYTGGSMVLRANSEVSVSLASSNIQRGTEVYGWAAQNYYSHEYSKLGSLFVYKEGNSSFESDSDGWNNFFFPAVTSWIPEDENDQRLLYKYYGHTGNVAPSGGSVLHDGIGSWGLQVADNKAINGLKSAFFIEDKVILLGSDIRNNKDDGSVVTTLLQEKSGGSDLILDGLSVNSGSQQILSDEHWLEDKMGTVYYVPKQSGSQLVVEKKNQSYTYVRSTNLKTPRVDGLPSDWKKKGKNYDDAFRSTYFKDTGAVFHKAYLENTGGRYHYAISLPVESELSAQQRVDELKAAYRIVAHDNKAHAIYHAGKRFFGAVNFTDSEQTFVIEEENLKVTMPHGGYLSMQFSDENIIFSIAPNQNHTGSVVVELTNLDDEKDIEWTIKTHNMDSLLNKDISISRQVNAVKGHQKVTVIADKVNNVGHTFEMSTKLLNDPVPDPVLDPEANTSDSDKDGISDEVEQYIYGISSLGSCPELNGVDDVTYTTDCDGNATPDVIDVFLKMRTGSVSFAATGPIITLQSETINVLSTGLYTSVHSTASAELSNSVLDNAPINIPDGIQAYLRAGDCAGNVLPANYKSICDLQSVTSKGEMQLLAGSHSLWWIAVDDQGNWPPGGAIQQSINVIPQVYFSTNIDAVANSEVKIILRLNGNPIKLNSAISEFEVPFTVIDKGTGSALSSGSFYFNGMSLSSTPLAFTLGPNEGVITIRLDTDAGVFATDAGINTEANRVVNGQKATIDIEVPAINHPPVVSLKIVNQNDVSVDTANVGDTLTVIVNASDANDDVLSYQWGNNVAPENDDYFTLTPTQDDKGQLVFRVTVSDSEHAINAEASILISERSLNVSDDSSGDGTSNVTTIPGIESNSSGGGFIHISQLLLLITLLFLKLMRKAMIGYRQGIV